MEQRPKVRLVRSAVDAVLVAGLLVAGAVVVAGPQAKELGRDAVAVVARDSVDNAARPSAARPAAPEAVQQEQAVSRPAIAEPVAAAPARPKPTASEPARQKPAASRPARQQPATVRVVRKVSGSSAPAAAQQYAPPRRIICHHVRGTRRIRGVRYSVLLRHATISVRQSFVRGHQRHGDTLGRCTTAANKRAHKAKAHVRRWHRAIRLRG